MKIVQNAVLLNYGWILYTNSAPALSLADENNRVLSKNINVLRIFIPFYFNIAVTFVCCSSELYISLCKPFVNFVLFTRDRILTNETQLNCFIPLSYSLIYIGCVKSYSAKFVRNHSLIRYFLHCDWLLPSTDLKGHSRLRWLCKPINVHNVHIHHLTCVTHESKSPTSPPSIWRNKKWCMINTIDVKKYIL